MKYIRVISLVFCAAILLVAGTQTSAFSQGKGNRTERSYSGNSNRAKYTKTNNNGLWSGRRDNDRQKKVAWKKNHGVRDHGHGVGNGKGNGKGRGWKHGNHKENNHRARHENRKRDHRRARHVNYKRRHR